MTCHSHHVPPIADASSGPVTFAVLMACVVACCLVVMDWLGIPAFEVAGGFIRGSLKWLPYIAVVLVCAVVGAICLGAGIAAGRDDR